MSAVILLFPTLASPDLLMGRVRLYICLIFLFPLLLLLLLSCVCCYLMCICCTMCVLLFLLYMPVCWLEVSIRKVLRPAISTQVFLGFPVPKSKC